jgi:hypothetical protein
MGRREAGKKLDQGCGLRRVQFSYSPVHDELQFPNWDGEVQSL